MSNSLSAKAIIEVQRLTTRAQELASKNRNTEASALLSQAATIRQTGLSTDEMRKLYAEALVEETIGEVRPQASREQLELRHNLAFGRYIAGKTNAQSPEMNEADFRAELRAIIDSGFAPNAQTYTDGPQGGYFVPQAFDRVLRDAIIQTDPVTSPDVVEVIQEDGFAMNAKNVTGFDLTTITASSTADGTQQGEINLQSVAPAHQAQIGNNPTYKVNLNVSLEAEEDIDQFAKRVAQAAGVALARKMGQDVISTLAGAISPSYETTTSGVITITDLQNIIFQVDRLYRQGTDGYGYVNVGSPKQGRCGWLMGDDVWGLMNRMGSGQANGQAGGNPQVPYLSALCSPGAESLCGYPVHICPSLASSVGSSPVANGLIYFGDLSKIIVRKSQVWAKRTFQSGLSNGNVTYGSALLTFRQRMGAVYFDPGAATKPAVVAATVRV